jgi:hypothetical protein
MKYLRQFGIKLKVLKTYSLSYHKLSINWEDFIVNIDTGFTAKIS